MNYPLPTPAAPPPVPDLPRLRKVLAHIDAHPEEWDQTEWALDVVDLDHYNASVAPYARRTACGTVFCIAGHTVEQAGYQIVWESEGDGSLAAGRVITETGTYRYIPNVARELLGLTATEASALFGGGNKRNDVQRVAEQIAARAGEQL